MCGVCIQCTYAMSATVPDGFVVGKCVGVRRDGKSRESVFGVDYSPNDVLLSRIDGRLAVVVSVTEW